MFYSFSACDMKDGLVVPKLTWCSRDLSAIAMDFYSIEKVTYCSSTLPLFNLLCKLLMQTLSYYVVIWLLVQ